MEAVVGGASERLKRTILGVQDFTLLSYRAFRNLLSPPRYWQDTFDMMDVIGVGSVTIVCLTGLFTGMVLTVQSSATLDAFGARPYVGRMVSLSMIRELGPVLTSLMVAGRVGSGMAAELGSMVVTQQIDAMRALGTDPIRKLVTPRMVAGVVMVPILTILSDAVGMLGGFLVARFTLRLATQFYWHSAVDAIRMQDIVMGLVKPLVFGYIVVAVGCYQGLSTRGGTQGVGVSTTRSVVMASVLILAADYFLNILILRFVYP
jgi:phospholipid/cholesterol/gamma-HCH transport system permease protein